MVQPAPPSSPPSSPLAVVAAVAVGIWAVFATTVLQGLGYLVDQLPLILDQSLPAWRWPVIGAVNAAAVVLPALPLALVPRSAAVRRTGAAWLAAGAALAALTALRAVPMVRHEFYLALLAAVAATGALLVGRGRRGRTAPPAILLAVAAGTLVLAPWLWLGALGGPLETALAVAAAAAVGWLAATVLGPRFWAPFAAWSRARLIGVGGLVAGVTLALLGAGVGQSGPNLAVLVGLPMVAFALAALWSAAQVPARGTATYTDRPSVRPPVGWLVAFAVVGPLAFVDPEETTLVLLGRDAPFWAAVAAGGALAAGLLVAIGYGLALGRRLLSRRVSAVLAGVLVAGGLAVYLVPGQPGFFGERLFVVMSTQADLAGLPAGTGQAALTARTTEVYRRLVAHAESSQASLRRDLDRWRIPYRPYYLVNGIEVSGGPVVRALLSRRDDVDRVLLAQRLRPLPLPPRSPEPARAAAPSAPEWNLTQIGAPEAWAQGATGQGIVVGSSDSGVDGAHPALAPGFRGGDDSWYDPWTGSTRPVDTGSHGTHTLGSAVGRAHIGVAPGAQWVGCVNLGRNLGNPARYLDCLQFMLAPFPAGGDPFADGDPARAPQVLTNSWGCPELEGCDLESLRPAIDAIDAAGIFFVAAAGNTGPTCGSVDDPPAPYADAFVVGATDESRRVAEFSSRGPAAGGERKPDIVAPGDEILSALPGGRYGHASGTSMATPHVAGVVALMWSANPSLVGDVARTREILRSTAVGVSVAPNDFGAAPCPPADVTGAGLVDADAAVRAARAAG